MKKKVSKNIRNDPGSTELRADIYRALFEKYPDPIYIHGMEGRILEPNPTAGDRLGYSPEELLKMRVTDLVGTEAAAKSQKRKEEILRTGSMRFESVHRCRDGKEFPVDVNACLIDYFGKPAVLATVRDISKHKLAKETVNKLNAELEGRVARRTASLQTEIAERKLAENALRKSEEKHRRLVENLAKGYFFYAHDTKGVFNYLSTSITSVLGYSQEEFLTHYTEYLTDNPINKEVVRHTDSSILGIPQPAYEVEIYHKDKSIHRLEVTETPLRGADGKVTGVEGLAHDITKRKRIETALQESEARYRWIIETTQEGFGSIDSCGRIVAVNPRLEEMFGYAHGEMLGLDMPNTLLRPEDRPGLLSQLRKRRLGWQSVYEQRFLRKDGSIFWGRVSGTSFINKSGSAGSFAMISDITDIKLTEEKIKGLNKELERTVDSLKSANKDLEEFTYSVSHDLLTPLRHITTFAKLLNAGAGSELKGETRHYLEVVSNSAKKMDILITSLLAFSKLARKKSRGHGIFRPGTGGRSRDRRKTG